MIEIKHLQTGEILHVVEADTLQGADLGGLNLSGADLNRASLQQSFLRKTDLSNALLTGASLHGTNLIDANLQGATVAGATLNNANLAGANLNGASFLHASLVGADLTCANLTAANLINANLSDAFLFQTVLTGVGLDDTQFYGATWGYTIISHCYDLHKAKGMVEIKHLASSSLDVVTLRSSVAALPEVFLQGVGYTPDEVENLRGMYSKSIVYYSCFLSHAGDDNEFVDKLRNDLRSRGVSCWNHRYDMHGGKYWRPQISEAIQLNDKLVLICTEQAIKSDNVAEEVIQAMNREREAESRKLFPLMLDNFIHSPQALALADMKTQRQEWSEDWVRYVQKFQILDFSQWKDHDAYMIKFKELLRDLKNPAAR